MQQETRQRYRQLQQSIEGLVQRARSTKLGADQRLAESVLSSDSAQSAELVRSQLAHLSAEAGQLAQIASPPAGGDGLGRQARICTPKVTDHRSDQTRLMILVWMELHEISYTG